MSNYETTAIWRAFEAKASAGHEASVRVLLDYAAGLLNAVNETFPTYTLHTSVHACNVARLMGELLGRRCDELSELEAAMLLLAAYWHDVGMVFDEASRRGLSEEPEFRTFLERHPGARVAVHEAGAVPAEIVEHYCRWRHGERVFVHLEAVELDHPGALMWGVLSLHTALGNVCRSHTLDARALHGREFETAFAAECDLRFCAILLRVADIMDFDRSRSPESLFRHLGLGQATHGKQRASSGEWRKHHSSAGFRFPGGDRTRPYAVGFVAGPDDPAVEYDLREFLDVVESELREAAALLRSCDERWSDLALPDRIDRDQIHSPHYKYGEHRFTLDRSGVLRLFMGENLYESPYTFVRELLQNAIDASRHREFHERGLGNGSFRAAPIQVTQWRDRDNYTWIRVQDCGMGMTEQILTDYFLMVGRSYYQSDSFKADLLRHADRGDEFSPISRFGIGVLSCFISGEQVQVSTRHVDGGDPIRLSLPSLEGFYALQVGRDMPATPMPDPAPEGAAGFRQHPGTTVAVRLDARKERKPLNLEALVSDAVFCSPVPILLDGEPIGGDPAELVDRPAGEHEVFELDAALVAEAARTLGAPLSDGLRLHVVPLDLTAATPDRALRGQAVAVFATGGPALQRALADNSHRYERSISIGVADGAFWVSCQHRTPFATADNEVEALIQRAGAPDTAPSDRAWMVDRAAEIERELAQRRETGEETADDPWPLHRYARLRTGIPARHRFVERNDFDWSHNGIRIPWHQSHGPPVKLGRLRTKEGLEVQWQAAVAMTDRWRPELHVSRDELLRMPWPAHSAANLALRRAIRRCGEDAIELAGLELYTASMFSRDVRLGDLVDDVLLSEAGGWRVEPLFGAASLDELVAGPAPRSIDPALVPSPSDISTWGPAFDTVCRAGLLALNAELAWIAGEDGWACEIARREAAVPTALLHFAPLFCVAYRGSSKLRSGDRALNSEHPFTRWLLGATDRLAMDFPGLLSTIRAGLQRHFEGFGRNFETTVSEVNSSLERLWQLDPTIVPRSLALTTDDFE